MSRMKRNEPRIRFKLRLFLVITMLITGVTILCVSAFCATFLQNSRAAERGNSRIVVERIATQIDGLYSQMEIAAISLTKHPALINAVFALQRGPELSTLEKLDLDRKVRSYLGNIMFFPNVSRVLLYDREQGLFLYTGLYLSDSGRIAAALDENGYARLLEKPASSLFLPPHTDPWGASQEVVSVCHSFDTASIHSTIVEVQVPARQLTALIGQESFGEGKYVLLIDHEGTILHALDGGRPELDSIQDALRGGASPDSVQGYSLVYAYAPVSGFRLVLVSDDSSLKAQQLQYFLYAALLAAAVLTVTLSALFILINRLVQPLNELVRHIDSISLASGESLHLRSDSLDEFVRINESFNAMVDKLKQSVKDTYEARLRESDANLAALQAQVSPHFLSNALYSISAASEIYGSGVTTRMCQALSEMMRYVIAGNARAKLIDEITHTKNYLELMRISNDGNFDYHIDVALECYTVELPRITIQPLVENCFKHGFCGCAPPWSVEITCRVAENRWEIAIQDSGYGFSEDFLREFADFQREYTALGNQPYQSHGPSGLGLKNIYARLFIFYKGAVYFTLQNNKRGGLVIIGRAGIK